jgi:hypothetical protein
MAIFTYDAAQHFLTLGGIPIQGFQDGSSITIEFDEDAVSKQVDVDGRNVVFNKTNNYTGSVTFTLNEGAASNDVLTGIYADFRRGAGGVVPMFFKDNNGRSLAQSEGCTVMTMPSIGGGRESSGRTWVLTTGQMQMTVGGAEAAI